MKSIIYKKHGISISHVWFSDKIEKQKSHLSIFHGMKSDDIPIDFSNSFKITPQSTLITDLSLTQDELWSKIKKNTRYEIRRAEKEGIEIKYYLGKETPRDILLSFEKVYNQMYKSKGKKTTFNKKIVEQYMKNEMIAFSIALYESEPLVFHSYIYDEDHTRFFYSCSPFRDEPEMANLIGRMNRLLHWNDFLWFKNMGVTEYDWGGINSDTNPDNIAKFKMSFGGVSTEKFNYSIGDSILGKLICIINK